MAPPATSPSCISALVLGSETVKVLASSRCTAQAAQPDRAGQSAGAASRARARDHNENGAVGQSARDPDRH